MTRTKIRKSVTFRLPPELAAEAEVVARVEHTSVNQLTVDALVEAVKQRRKDPVFNAAVRAQLAEDREILERLAGQ